MFQIKTERYVSVLFNLLAIFVSNPSTFLVFKNNRISGKFIMMISIAFNSSRYCYPNVSTFIRVIWLWWVILWGCFVDSKQIILLLRKIRTISINWNVFEWKPHSLRIVYGKNARRNGFSSVKIKSIRWTFVVLIRYRLVTLTSNAFWRNPSFCLPFPLTWNMSNAKYMYSFKKNNLITNNRQTQQKRLSIKRSSQSDCHKSAVSGKRKNNRWKNVYGNMIEWFVIFSRVAKNFDSIKILL